MICPKCGTETDSIDLICPNCGADLTKEETGSIKIDFFRMSVIPVILGFIVFFALLYNFELIVRFFRNEMLFKVLFYSFIMFSLFAFILVPARINIRVYDGYRSFMRDLIYETCRAIEAICSVFGVVNLIVALVLLMTADKDVFSYFAMGFFLLVVDVFIVIFKRSFKDVNEE